MHKGAAAFYILFFAGMVALYGALTEYTGPEDPATRRRRYPHFTDLHVMVFVGLTFLFAFLARGGFTATCHAFVAACYAVLWANLNRGFWYRVVEFDRTWDKIKLSVDELVSADFCAAAVLISFGALVGRVTAAQLLMLVIIEVIIWSINEAVVLGRLGVSDVGGSMIIHTFGAYFGLACAFVLEKFRPHKNAIVNARSRSQITDTMAMFGTLFLFVYWPSFNAALAGADSQDRAVVNTYLSIVSSCIAAFLINILLHQDGRLSMEVMQNSTIAGGVAMGACADMVVNPFGAMVIGFVAGSVAAFAYIHLKESLGRKMGLRDASGVHMLFGLPGLIGGIASAIAAGARRAGSYNGTMMGTRDSVFRHTRSSEDQAGHQMAGIGISLGFALFGGAITGLILSFMPSSPEYFDDDYEFVARNNKNAPGVTDQTTQRTADAVVMNEARSTHQPNEPLHPHEVVRDDHAIRTEPITG